MNTSNKGKSPFYPGQPVPVEFFIGRLNEIKRIERSIKQVEMGKQQAIFLTGEYGIGKSSLAGYMKYIAEQNNHLLGIHVLLGGAETIDDIAVKTVETVIKDEIYKSKTNEKIRNFFSKYIGKQELFGFSLNFKVLEADGPNISKGYLPFLRELLKRVKDDGIKGILLIFDEINGISNNKKFAHFIKTLVDENALSRNPLPLMLILCGVEERRKDMINNHPPIERIFDIVNINPMNNEEMKDFFIKSFKEVDIKIDDKEIATLSYYSAGFPKIMHIIGDSVFWIDKDNYIDKDDAFNGVFIATEEVGKKFVDQQVYKALRSKDYHSILKKLGNSEFSLSFKKRDIKEKLTKTEKKKFNNFLLKMKKLNILKSGNERGEYIFNSRLIRLYFLLKSSDTK